MIQLNLKFYMFTFLCFAGVIASAQGTQEICLGDIKNYSVSENSGSTYVWEVEEAAFSGNITENTVSGNAVQVDWKTTPAGAYTLTVIETNSEGCPGLPVSVTININPLPDAPVVELIQPGCGEDFGSMTVKSPIGVDLKYSIDGGANFQDSVNFNNLDPGAYEVIAQNGSGCLSEPTPFKINEPLVIPADPVVTVTSPQCGETTGSLDITAPTGTELQYSIDGGATFTTNLNYTGLAPGDYDVVVTNGDCESVIVTVTIDPAPSVPADPEFSILNPGCGETEGTITITKPLGSDLEYSADGGTTWQVSEEFFLAAGVHQIQVRNTVSGCTSRIVDATIQEAPEVPVTSPIQFN